MTKDDFDTDSPLVRERRFYDLWDGIQFREIRNSDKDATANNADPFTLKLVIYPKSSSSALKISSQISNPLFDKVLVSSWATRPYDDIDRNENVRRLAEDDDDDDDYDKRSEMYDLLVNENKEKSLNEDYTKKLFLWRNANPHVAKVSFIDIPPETEPPTLKPTHAPTLKPTYNPTAKPTKAPTKPPTKKVTQAPTVPEPTPAPTQGADLDCPNPRIRVLLKLRKVEIISCFFLLFFSFITHVIFTNINMYDLID